MERIRIRSLLGVPGRLLEKEFYTRFAEAVVIKIEKIRNPGSISVERLSASVLCRGFPIIDSAILHPVQLCNVTPAAHASGGRAVSTNRLRRLI